MKTFLNNILSAKGSSNKGLYDFFQNTSAREQNRIIRKVIRESNKDQRDLVEQYNKKILPGIKITM